MQFAMQALACCMSTLGTRNGPHINSDGCNMFHTYNICTYIQYWCWNIFSMWGHCELLILLGTRISCPLFCTLLPCIYAEPSSLPISSFLFCPFPDSQYLCDPLPNIYIYILYFLRNISPTHQPSTLIPYPKFYATVTKLLTLEITNVRHFLTSEPLCPQQNFLTFHVYYPTWWFWEDLGILSNIF